MRQGCKWISNFYCIALGPLVFERSVLLLPFFSAAGDPRSDVSVTGGPFVLNAAHHHLSTIHVLLFQTPPF